MVCYECGGKATEKHHLVPKSLGGTKTVNLCSGCHCKIHGFTGSRINAVDLSRLGRMRKDYYRTVAIMVWDFYDYSYRTNAKNLAARKRNNYNSYKIFSGDYKVTKDQFQRRYLTISKWAAEQRWSWFIEMVADAECYWALLMIKVLSQKYKVKTYNYMLYDSKQEPNKSGLMRQAFGGTYYRNKPMNWDFASIPFDHTLWKNTYEDDILQNLITNFDVQESRWNLMRERPEHEQSWLENEDLRHFFKHIHRLF